MKINEIILITNAKRQCYNMLNAMLMCYPDITTIIK